MLAAVALFVCALWIGWAGLITADKAGEDGSVWLSSAAGGLMGASVAVGMWAGWLLRAAA